jgi:antimicrobial peptide system SdpB family protein
MRNKIKRIEASLALKTERYTPYTNTIGIARSILALGTLLTLLSNPIYYLIPISTDHEYLNPLIKIITLNKYNVFLLLGVNGTGIMKWLAVAIMISVISGYFMKITAVLHWWVSISFFYCSSFIDGGDQIAAILSLLLMPICLTDKRKNHWSQQKPNSSPVNLIGIYSIWVIRLQVAVLYLVAAVGKFNVVEWGNGTALYYWMNHSIFGMPDFLKEMVRPLLSSKVIQPLLTYGVMIFEICLFLGLKASIKYRKRIFVLAVIFHLLIIIFHGIFSFFFSITAALILYLYPTYQNINITSARSLLCKRQLNGC